MLPNEALSNVKFICLRHFWELLLHARVPMVLNGVVSATLKHLGNLSPLVPVVSVHEVEDPLFLLAPADLFDLRVQMIVPPLSALLANPTWEIFSYQGPFLRAVLVNQMKNHPVFLLSPRTLDEAWIQHFLPTMKALDVSTAWQLLGDFLPVFASMLPHCIGQMLVLKRVKKLFIGI